MDWRCSGGPGLHANGESAVDFHHRPKSAHTYVQNWNLNIQQQINPAVAFEVGYVGSKGTKLTRLYDKNQDFTNPDYAAIDVFSGGANSTYNALQATARLQNFHGFSGFSTYAFAKSLDGASDGIDFNFATAAFPQNSDNVAAEKGPSTFDTRHRWTTALTYVVPTFERLPHAAGGWLATEYRHHRAIWPADSDHHFQRHQRHIQLPPAPECGGR